MAFEVVPPGCLESDSAETDPAKRCSALAKMKAEDVSAKHLDAAVLGCDTLVAAADGTLLEKPVDARNARRMLRFLGGQEATVHSALHLIVPGRGGGAYFGRNASGVRFRALTDADVEWWISTGLWRDRSGAFQIDGPGQLLIERLEGDWTGVVGLPVFLLGRLLKEAGTPFGMKLAS